MKSVSKKRVGSKTNGVATSKKGVSKPRKSAKAVKQNTEASIPMLKIGLWDYRLKSGKLKWSGNVSSFLKCKGGVPATILAFQKCLSADDQLNFKATLNKSVKSKRDFYIEVGLNNIDKTSQWIELNASPVLGANGSVLKYSGTIRDISRKKQNELELANWKIKNELISDSAGLLIYDYDIPSGKIEWNGNLKEIVGFSSDEMNTINKWEDLIHPDDRKAAFELLETSGKALKPYDVYYRFRKKNGEFCYMHDRGLFVANSKGKAQKMLGIMGDVSAQISAMNNVARSEKSYRELFDTVGEAIYIQDTDGTFLDVNHSACQMYGYSKDEMVGKNPEFLSAPGKNDFDQLKLLIAQALQGKQQNFDWWGKKKNGEVFLKEVRLNSGNYFGKQTIIATAFDITDKVKTKSSLQESEKRFQRMIEDLNIGVILSGPNSELLTANRAGKEILQIREEGVALTSGATFINESGEVLDSESLPWKIAVKTESKVHGELLGVCTTDDKISWFIVNADPAFHEQQLQHVVITFTDISERKRMEEYWKESELRFRTLQEASFGGIGLHRMGMLLDCNQGLCDLTGFSYDELIGMNGINLIAPEFQSLVIDKIVTKNTHPYDVVGVRKDGSRYFLEIQGKNIPYKDGQLRVTEFRNITERKLTEEKILEQNAKLLLITEDLKQKNDQLQEFTQIVSHNLRSPVGNILSLLGLIENAEDDEERKDAMHLLKEAGTTTLTTLTELNQVLQIQQSKNVQRQELNFEEVFIGIKKLLNAKIAEAGAGITTDFTQAPMISFPKIYLESILLNLLSNALKYVYPGRKPEIHIKTVLNEDQSISMFVADNGSGLNMKKYGHQIFKLRKTFHKHPESRGIGLFMIKNQIEAMGGRISVSSTENEGSVFQIDFNKSPKDE